VACRHVARRPYLSLRRAGVLRRFARKGVGGRYVWLWLFGLALGWFETAVVVYLRELYYPEGFVFPVVWASTRIASVEIAREVASLLILAAVARLSGERFLERFGAFMLLFGIWDIVYYLGLFVVLGWPAGLATWDLLFLIPVPWVGPVWAPLVIALLLVGAGSYLYWTSEMPRRPAALDWGVEIAAGLIVILSMTWEWRVVLDEREPQHFPAWLFWGGLAIGVLWFLRFERAARRDAEAAGGAC